MLFPAFAMRAVGALLLGFLIGAERQWRHRNAGIRTNALVSLGSALFVLLAVLIEGDSSPTRVPAQIVSGIGFLGAGVIFKEGFSVSGLNTAATIWTTAAVGSLAGYGFLQEAALGTVLVLGVNTLLRISHRAFNGSGREIEIDYRLQIVCSAEEEHHIRTVLYTMLVSEGIPLMALASEDSDIADRVEVTAHMRMSQARVTKLEQVVSRIGLEQSVAAVRWDTAA